jgi:hypothetical protein
MSQGFLFQIASKVFVFGSGGFCVLANALPEAIALANPATPTAPVVKIRRRILSIIALR